MTIRATPPLSETEIQAEFPDPGSEVFNFDRYLRGVGPVPASVLQIPATFPLSWDDFLNARKSTPGSVEWTDPGRYEFVVPPYATMTVEVNGAGGGAGSSVWENYGAPVAASGNSGFPGEESRFLALVGGGGGGGGGGIGTGARTASPGVAGTPGTALGGTTNTPGGGMLGGAGKPYLTGLGPGGSGGNGGKAVRTYTVGEPGAPVVGEQLFASVGVGAAAGAFPGNQGTNGQNGKVRISWT